MYNAAKRGGKESWWGMKCKGLYNVEFWLIERWGGDTSAGGTVQDDTNG